MAFDPIIHFMKEIHGKFNSSIFSGLQGHKNSQHAAFLRQLQRDLSKEKQIEEPLKSLKVVVFDLETTGFYPDKGDTILSIGAIKVEGSTIVENETFYSLVYHTDPLSEEITFLTGITDEQVQAAPTLSTVLVNFFEFVQDSILVAHHATHEKNFLQYATWKLFRTPLKHRIIDTSFLFHIADPKLNLIRLEDYCNHHDIPVIDRHHALGDARLTAKLWSMYLDKIYNSGIVTLGDLYDKIARSK